MGPGGYQKEEAGGSVISLYQLVSSGFLTSLHSASAGLHSFPFPLNLGQT